MTSVFDGLAGVLNGVFGASVTIYPGGGGATAIQGIIRDSEVLVAGEHGEAVSIAQTTLKAIKSDVATLVAGDLVVGFDSTQYRVSHRIPAESPADDRFETFVLKVD